MNSRLKWFAVVVSLLCAAPVVRSASPDEMVARFITARKAQFAGMPRLVVDVISVANGRRVTLAVPNQEEKKPIFDPLPDLLSTTKSLKAGDFIKITYEMQYNNAMVKTIAAYPIKPGEELANGFVFNETYEKKEGELNFQMVDAKKFDQVISFVIPGKKDAASGAMAPDAELMAEVTKLKPDDVVLIDAANTHPYPTLKSIEAYTPPQPGHFIKSKLETGDNGRKNTIAEIEANGTTIDAIVPGRMAGKNWIPNAKVLGEIRRLSPNTDVMFRVTDDNGKTWLREIEKAPKQSHTPSAPKSADTSAGNKAAGGAKPDAKSPDGAAAK